MIFKERDLYEIAGKYFIGDPCYAIKDELWSEFCNNF